MKEEEEEEEEDVDEGVVLAQQERFVSVFI